MIRVVFENRPGVRVDDRDAFQRYVAPYVERIPSLHYAGYIVLDATKTYFGRLEPLWSYMMGEDATERDLAGLRALREAPPPGYVVHVIFE